MSRHQPRTATRALALLLALPLAVAGATAAGAATAPASAESLARRSMAAMGGEDLWAATRLLRFDFTSRRDGKQGAVHSHWWDRTTGDYRVEGTDREGRTYRVLFDLDDRQGRAWRDGREASGEELAKLLEMGYARFINDTYWLLMPWKWLDPGVTLTHEGRRTVDGADYEVLTLAFASGVGLTSNDRYWAYVSPDSGRIARWAYVLQDAQGAPGTGEPTVWAWEEWRPTAAGIELSTVRRQIGGADVQILFPVAEAWATPSAEQLREAFAPPAPSAPGS
jgi:hypothetical protein